MSYEVLFSALRRSLLVVSLLAALTAGATGAFAEVTDTCNAYVEYEYINQQNYYQIGDTIRVEITLGAGLIVGGTHVTVNRVRFELDCTSPGVPCPDAGNLVSYVGNITTTCPTSWAANSAGGTLPNEVVFSSTPGVEIPPRQYRFCNLQFDIQVEAFPPVGTTIREAAGFTMPNNDAVCNTPGLLPASAQTAGDIRICNCDDGSACTAERCDPTLGCIYAPVLCDDGNACTTDTCDPASGCGYAPNTLPCGDNDACTTSDTCANGVCAGGPPLNCDDGNACTTDTCDQATGCVHSSNNAPCDDGLACTTSDTCSDGACTGTPKDCSDANVCTLDTCLEPAGACAHSEPSGQCDLLGAIYYYRDSAGPAEPSIKPVPGSSVLRLSSMRSAATSVTGPSGQYQFLGEAGEVSVAPLQRALSDEAECLSAITAQDAGLISKAVVQLAMLTDNQMIAADVTGSGTVSSYDAALTAQKASAVSCAGYTLPIQTIRGADWEFSPASMSFTPLAGTETCDFLGILYGDVTGNWSSAGPLAPSPEVVDPTVRQFPVASVVASAPPAQPAGPGAELYLAGSPIKTQEGPWEAVLGLKNADGIMGLDIALRHDPALVRIRSVSATGLASSFGLVSNDGGDNDLIALYNIEPMHGSGDFLVVTYDLTGTAGELPFSVAAQANEGQIPVILGAGIPRGGTRRPVIQADAP